MKYDLPLLDLDTRFSLWQVKMRAVLAHNDLDDSLDGFGKKDYNAWSVEEKRKVFLIMCMLIYGGRPASTLLVVLATC
jgi:hypothetical protein